MSEPSTLSLALHKLRSDMTPLRMFLQMLETLPREERLPFLDAELPRALASVAQACDRLDEIRAIEETGEDTLR